MAFRFQRRVTLWPGVRLSFGKTGVSLSAEIRGASITAGKRGCMVMLVLPTLACHTVPALIKRQHISAMSPARKRSISGSWHHMLFN